VLAEEEKEDPMKVQFELDREDFVAFQLYFLTGSPTFRRRRVRTTMVCLYLAGLLAIPAIIGVAPEEPGLDVVAWGFVGLFALMAMLHPYFTRQSVRKLAGGMFDEGKNRTLLGKIEVVLTPAEVACVGGFGAWATRWEAVEKIAEDKSALYVYLPMSAAFIIPRRAFQSEPEYTTFVETARKYLEAAATARAPLLPTLV
jgi:hypothetical protein